MAHSNQPFLSAEQPGIGIWQAGSCRDSSTSKPSATGVPPFRGLSCQMKMRAISLHKIKAAFQTRGRSLSICYFPGTATLRTLSGPSNCLKTVTVVPSTGRQGVDPRTEWYRKEKLR